MSWSQQILPPSSSVPFSFQDSSPSGNVSRGQETGKAAPRRTVTYVYQAKIAESYCNVTAKWCKNVTNHSLCITLEKPCQYNQLCTCKIDLNSTQSWGKKGLKSFEVDGRRVDVYWDFRQATFSSTPEPCKDYYVAMVSKQEVVLMLGDLEQEAHKRTRSKTSLEEAKLMFKEENVCGKSLFCSKALLQEGIDKKEHDIVIEAALSGPNEPEMWISVDGRVAIRIMNLNWRFRGNETVIVNDDLAVEIFWDVHDWLFSSSSNLAGTSSSHGFFVFKPGRLELDNYWDQSSSSPKGSSSSSSSSTTLGFCHFLYAWKTE